MSPSPQVETVGSTSGAMRHPRLVWMFACMPVFDAGFNQITNHYKIGFGPLSTLEVVRGGLVALYVFIILTRLGTATRRMLAPLISVACGILILLMVCWRDAISYHNLTVAAIVSYFQMLYWMLTWATVLLVCRTARDCRLVLCGVAAGAVLTAISVILGLWFGGLNPYEINHVTASTGWFNSPKNITAILVIGAVLCVYLLRSPPARSRYGWIAAAGACVCAAACMVTYARAGAVALACTLLWLLAWRITFGRSADHAWLTRFAVLLAMAAVCSLALAGPSHIFARWSDFSDSDTAGSGRASFWVIAFHAYEKGGVMERALGNGYQGMGDILLTEYGDDIKHTHNDLLDMLMVGGISALTWLLLHLAVVGWMVVRINPRLPEFALAGAVAVTYLCHGMFTGQLFSTDASTCYLICVTCLTVLAPTPVKELLWDRHKAYLGAAA